MGFSEQQAQAAVSQYDTVQQALDSLLAGLGLYHEMHTVELGTEYAEIAEILWSFPLFY